MKRFGLILLACLLLAAAGCRRTQTPGDSVLNLSIYVRGSEISKAEEGPVGAVDAERNLHSLQVWVFRHSDGALLCYFSPDISSYNFQNGQVIRLSASLEPDVARAAPSVDVYALANGEALASGLNQDTPRSTLSALSLTGSQFGVSPLQEAVPDEGLPLAGSLVNVPMKGVYPVMKIESVAELTRLVSKIRFVFCQLKGENNTPPASFALTGISLTGSIRERETVFSEGGSGSSALNLNWTGSALPSSLALNPAPTSYLAGNYTTAQEYDSALNQGVRDGTLTQFKQLYLRESTAAFGGALSYTVDGVEKTPVAFTLPAGEFLRNHYWVVYAYFIGGKLVVKPTAFPWDAGHDRYAFNTQGSVEMDYYPYLRYDIDQKANTWNDTYVSVAYGYESGSNIPRYSSAITLETQNINELRLQVNSELFEFVQVVLDEEANPLGYNRTGQRISIPGSPEKQITRFYLVPVDNTTYTDRRANVVLTEIFASGAPPTNIPFNHDLPGDEDHTTIKYYNIGAATYNSNQGNIKQDGNDQASQYWIEEPAS